YTTKKQGKGTGLGLAAVYGTLQDHQGSITVSSELGKGTSFYILLPCSDNAIKTYEIEPELLTGSGQILLVDDEEIIRLTGRLMMEKMGYNVLLAENGREAVEIFKEKYRAIDLVILDMIMPEMNGRDAFFEMRKVDKNCKVVISSGFGKNKNLEELKKSGITGFIRKPYSDYELSKLLAKVLKT
ncbi:MAG: response regulator, partial [bacterium]|nr:response regulator [bacterium]